MDVISFSLPLPSQASVKGYLHEEMHLTPQREKRPAVVICPGGGYAFVSPREADPPAMAFFARGYNVFILTYSVKTSPEQAPLGLAPLCELSRALITIREHNAEWHVDPDKIAVCGFSAGGHLCASLGTLWDSPALQASMDTHGGMNKPNAMILCYPVTSSGEYAHRGSFENLTGGEPELLALLSAPEQVTHEAPPTFLWHTAEDAVVPVENAMLMASALMRAKIPCECHIFPHGGHGLSMCNTETNSFDSHCGQWFALCANWLAALFQFGE